jgi:Arc/MetJ-type ribon-helix-helix transcriptional regulator
MEKTTVYLPEGLIQSVKRVAARKRVSEAAVIRAALEHYTGEIERPRPRTALYETGHPIDDWDAALEGFGER